MRRYGHSRILGHIEPHFGGRGGRRGQRWHHSKERWWFTIGSPLLPLRTCAICNHSAAICDRMSPTLKSTGVGSLWAQISGCSPWSRFMMFGSAESERPALTNSEIIFEEKNSILCDHNPPTSQTDGQTDGRHVIARPRFALKCIAR